MEKVISKEGDPFFCLSVRGSDYEIGRQIGSATSADIADLWENFMLPRMAGQFGTPECKYQASYEWLRKNLEKVNPGIVERLDGIAAGSGVEEEKVWLMNHYAVLWSGKGLFCTTAAVRDSDAGPVLGQNLDIGREDIYYVTKTYPKNGYAILGEAMCSMWCSSTGVNEKGLAVGSSNLASTARVARKPFAPGIPVHFIPKLVLHNCAGVAEAVEFIKSLPSVLPESGGYQMNFIDAQGNMAVVDKTGPYVLARQCEPDLNFTTNFSLDEKLEKWRTEGGIEHPNIYKRAENIRSSYAALNSQKPTVSWLKKLFRSHEGIGRLCRHGEEEYGLGYSRMGFVYYPRQRQAEISNGWPCCNEYQQFSL
ncbi:MAG: C45 family peptidase [Planctomycetota bacterium]